MKLTDLHELPNLKSSRSLSREEMLKIIHIGDKLERMGTALTVTSKRYYNPKPATPQDYAIEISSNNETITSEKNYTLTLLTTIAQSGDILILAPDIERTIDIKKFVETTWLTEWSITTTLKPEGKLLGWRLNMDNLTEQMRPLDTLARDNRLFTSVAKSILQERDGQYRIGVITEPGSQRWTSTRSYSLEDTIELLQHGDGFREVYNVGPLRKIIERTFIEKDSQYTIKLEFDK